MSVPAPPELSKVPCKYCGEPTHMLGTKQCDRCFEVSSRVRTMGPATLWVLLNDISRNVRWNYTFKPRQP